MRISTKGHAIGSRLVFENGTVHVLPPNDPWATLDALQARFSAPPRPPGSFTLAEYRQRYGMNPVTAHNTLERMVQDGALKKQQAIVSGKRVNVFWIPPEETQACPTGRGTRTTRHGG